MEIETMFLRLSPTKAPSCVALAAFSEDVKRFQIPGEGDGLGCGRRSPAKRISPASTIGAICSCAVWAKQFAYTIATVNVLRCGRCSPEGKSGRIAAIIRAASKMAPRPCDGTWGYTPALLSLATTDSDSVRRALAENSPIRAPRRGLSMSTSRPELRASVASIRLHAGMIMCEVDWMIRRWKTQKPPTDP
jgi:hypothetical protein